MVSGRDTHSVFRETDLSAMVVQGGIAMTQLHATVVLEAPHYHILLF